MQFPPLTLLIEPSIIPTPLATSAKGSQRAGKSESAGEGEWNATTGGAACEVIGSGSEICGEEFRQTEGGYTVEYREIQAASTENSRSAQEISGTRTAWPRKCKRILQKSSEKELKTTPASSEQRRGRTGRRKIRAPSRLTLDRVRALNFRRSVK